MNELAKLHYKPITFNHANLNRPVTILLGTISSYIYSEKINAVCISTTGGIIPVKETVEEIDQLINKNSYKGEITNG